MKVLRRLSVLLIAVAILVPPLGSGSVYSKEASDDVLRALRSLENRIAALEHRLQQLENRSSDTSEPEEAKVATEGEWTSMGDGWQYRNPTLLSGGMDVLVLEVRRTGPTITVASITATFYNNSGGIAAIAQGFVNGIRQGQTKTTSLVFDKHPGNNTRFRLQVDYAM